MKIIICCSVRFHDQIVETMKKMEKVGITPLFPNFDLEASNRDQAIDADHKLRLALEHYAAVEDADAAYFLLPGGYMGSSVKIELGYTLACKKPVYFSEPTGDVDIDCYAKAMVSPDQLEFLLHE